MSDVWTGFSADPRPPGSWRVEGTDADRDHTATVLREAYADGRLARATYEERRETALAARTLGDLRPLLADLVASGGRLPTSMSDELRERATARYRADLRRARTAWIVISLLSVAVWGVIFLLDRSWQYGWPVYPFLGLGVLAVGVRGTREQRIEEHADRIVRARRARRTARR